MKSIKYFCIIFILALATTSNGWAAQTEHEQLRREARQAFNDGNWKDAYLLYQQLCLEATNAPELIGHDLLQAWQCLRYLNRLKELDPFREAVIDKHFDNWRLLWAAGGSYSRNNHRGYEVAGEFLRGQHRGGGRYMNAIRRDRVRALQLMNRALLLAAVDPNRRDVADLCLEYADTIMRSGGLRQAWRLQYLTDLKTLPDLEPGYGSNFARASQGAPVDAEGQPIFHKIPKSFNAAKSDGERWRWLLVNATELSPELNTHVKFTFASFLHQHFGVQTLSDYSHYFAKIRPVLTEDSNHSDSNPYAVHTLSDCETLARLANGVKRFELPEEFNYLKQFKEISSGQGRRYPGDAVKTLATIYENRRLYDLAVDYWDRYKKYNLPESHRHMDQITKSWGIFEPIGPQPSGHRPTVEYRFRNGSEINFKAYRIRIDQLLDDVKSYIRSNPRRLDRKKIRIDNIGSRLIHENQTKYIDREVSNWNLRLDPDKRHWDRRITVNLPKPMDQSGAYLLVGKIRNGNTARIIVWVSDTVLVKKPLDKQVLYYAADAVSGKPLAHTKVEFFGYRAKGIKDTNRYQILFKDDYRLTDRDGRIIRESAEMEKNYHWLALIRVGNRLAFLGFSSVWYPNYNDRGYNQTKTFIMTDRPVYRPNQKVHFKIWVRHAKYDQADSSTFAGQSFSVKIHNPQNEQVYSRSIQADSHGGLAGEFEIPPEAALGVYRISHNTRSVYGGNTFRVEEYKKPEFEVTVSAPDAPVMLGEKIAAIIKAEYYFGSPVTEASIKYKVYRNEHNERWYPAFDWDWFYGPGYWWYGYDYPWYPGWRLWGCKRPAFSWWQDRPRLPPEVVAEGEVKIGHDGTVRLEIDTELTKQIHGDTDHRYTISAEVRDQSRRTIVSRGRVLVARRPFKVYAWVNRGHYRVGDSIQAGFKAQTLDQKPVQGKGLLKLLRVTYQDNEPQESEVGRWNLATDSLGRSQIQLQASRAGQYRLSYQVTDSKSHTIEGGYIFTVRGEGDDGGRYRFAKIELIPENREYAPGDRVRLRINTDRQGAAVVLFVRPSNGIYLPPKVIHMTGKSTIEEIPVTKKDMPNFFVEAFSVYDGKIHNEMREIIVPPEKKVLNVAIQPSQNTYRPGQRANFKIKITDYKGQPVQGAAVMTVYDRALEYIYGGSNVPEIRSFFWKWRRRHQSHTESSLARRFYNLIKKNETPMRDIGVFGHLMFQDIADPARAEADEIFAPKHVRSTMAPAAAEAGIAGKTSILKQGQDDRTGVVKKSAVETELTRQNDSLENLMKPQVRTQFADTAYWSGTILTDSSGMAEVDFSMPQNLTGWKAMVWSMGHGTKVGQGSVDVVTRKNLILRLQAPRFFVETDEVVLSANVHNYLKTNQTARVILEFEGDCLAVLKGEKPIKSIAIDPNAEMRVDWRVKVLREGQAVIRIKALTQEESDAVQMHFPVYVHGMIKQVPKSGVIRPNHSAASILFEIPAERRVEASRLELRFSPTLAGSMVDALPYLTSFPYGCTEQTLNRFLPTVITQQILLKMGLDLRAIKAKQIDLNSREIDYDRQQAEHGSRYAQNPVFDPETVADMVQAGVKRLANMQLSDGGWGWFSGYGERSYPHTTAYVVHGLQIARANHVILPEGLLEKGIRWLQTYQGKQVVQLHRYDLKKNDGKRYADNLDAFVYMVLVDENIDLNEMQNYLHRDRNQLAVYAKAMLGMALYKLKDDDKLAIILKNIEQYLVQDDENQTAHLNLPNQSYWWSWYGSEYEAHGYYLKLLSRTEPQSKKASRLVKYLLNNRKHATYWKSTRDTAVVVEALAEYLTNSGEDQPDLTLEIYFDDIKKKTVKINAGNLFTSDNKFILEGSEISTGTHTIKLNKTGQGSIYFNAYLNYFTLEDSIAAEGLEIKVHRQVYRLKKTNQTIQDVGNLGQGADRQVEKLVRAPLENQSIVKSGELVEVELEIVSKNDYEYLVFEDFKAAGFEPVEFRSGYNNNEMGAYVEYRDRKVCFFVPRLARGRHSISYRLRAETPGKFSALPARGYAMYAPELKANSDEIKFIIDDRSRP